jgi:hypothetical protein
VDDEPAIIPPIKHRACKQNSSVMHHPAFNGERVKKNAVLHHGQKQTYERLAPMPVLY